MKLSQYDEALRKIYNEKMSRVDFDRYKEINSIDGGTKTLYEDMRDLVDVSINHLRKDIVKIDRSTK